MGGYIGLKYEVVFKVLSEFGITSQIRRQLLFTALQKIESRFLKIRRAEAEAEKNKAR